MSVYFWKPVDSTARFDTLDRPDIIRGEYPDRLPTETGGLTQFVLRIQNKIVQRVRPIHSRSEKFLKIVNALDPALSRLSPAQLTEEILLIRKELAQNKITDPLLAKCFALIREVSKRELNMSHYDVQIIGGWALFNGYIAEMETGEGKTLTATLPACTAALAGVPVHIVTVNDYLVQRDAELMRPIYRAFGLTVGCITENLGNDERQAAYACNIVYGTSKQLAFDYLKDRLAMGRMRGRLRHLLLRLSGEGSLLERILMRGLCFAIVDEADSLLIDEARTPLIISAEGQSQDQEKLYREALDIAAQLIEDSDFIPRKQTRTIELTERGRAVVAELTKPLGGVWAGVNRSTELIIQALTALHLFHRDEHYLIRDKKIQIIDEYTGRVFSDRSWEKGLHQLIEVKEQCPVTMQKDTLARISFQQFFRRYFRLAGMTGTAIETADELSGVYALTVVRMPTNRPLARKRLPTRYYPSQEQKWQAIVTRIEEIHRTGRPILVGTRSVKMSEHLSSLLHLKDLPHQVLNARQDQHEAEIISRAGEPGRITVATNMAGRGTDIKLAEDVLALGGLHVIGTEFHESRRIDRQLFGRCGRQGDPGSYEMFASIEDELFAGYGFTLRRQLAGRLCPSHQEAKVWFLNKLAGFNQKSVEKRYQKVRRGLLKMDAYLRTMLAFSGKSE
jgi:preprotein translocase subunit SecA